MAKQISRTFRTIKPHVPNSNSILSPSPKPPQAVRIPPRKAISPPSLRLDEPSSSISRTPPSNSWAVYLILSTNPPIKTYVGVTNDFSRRLKQHNGELVGGAKASRAGRPWICACLILGFQTKSEACKFESKWKSLSRKLPRKGRSRNEEEADSGKLFLLRHRYTALNRVQNSIDTSNLEIHWHLDPD